MKWIVTGGCGFIGRALIQNLLVDQDHQVRVYDNLSVGLIEDLEKLGTVNRLDPDGDLSDWTASLALVEADILESDCLSRAVAGADVVVHLAANTGVFPSVQNPRMDCETNVIGTFNALEACRSNDVSRFIFASSGAPLGVQEPPLHEELAPHPASPYGASKLAGEGYCSAYYHCFGVESVVLRFGNVYGQGSTLKASVVAKFIKQAMNGEALEIYGDGAQTRDFIHISDLVRAIRCAAEVPAIGGETFQIATSSETTVAELSEKLIAAMAAEGIDNVELFNGQKRQGDVARNFSDTSKAREQMGWEARISLEDGLRQTVRYFVNNENHPEN